MNESAITPIGEAATPPTRSARMQRTRLAITVCSRELTAEHGFSGFTIEELCSRVGISRRTFFNYFATKLDAVFGHVEDGLSAETLARFMDARPAGTVGISPTLFADLVELVLTQLRRDEAEILSAHGFFEAVHREPELLAKMVEVGPERMKEFMALVARREGVALDHPGLVMLVHNIQFATHQAVQRYVVSSRETSLEEEFLSLMRHAQELFAQPMRR
ncbi:AcrR family transcriptional regulator [Paeniglutamicibacter kerguelensis]|uniref:AcrR family transcriptional regulator n=2 Tax=Paeniglutamicibacter kerguelensis TaxID=254788 RepID=A0ABS4X8W0_9MICC|nr:AcrR family transcriptional regulator [Paeniglutamicibacter kerguelensis]